MFKPCVGMVVGNQYTLTKPLGEGGMGIVFEATDYRGRQVALKFLRPEAAGEYKRFKQEGTILQRLEHPNLIKCFGAGEANGVAYLVLEYFDGRSMVDILEHETLSWLQGLQIAAQLNTVIYYIHTQKIGHRDIRPDNILIRMTPHGPAVKLVDFGIARDRGSRDRMTISAGQLLGAASHLPPESFRRNGMPTDSQLIAADLYGLGLTLIELFTGRDPFSEMKPELLMEARYQGVEVEVTINTGCFQLDRLLRGLIDSEPVNRPRYEDIRDVLNSVPDPAWLAYVSETAERRSSFPGARGPFHTLPSLHVPDRPPPSPPLRLVEAPRPQATSHATAVRFDLAVEPQAVSSQHPRSGPRPVDRALLELRAGFPDWERESILTDPGARPASLPGALQQPSLTARSPSPTLRQWLASAPAGFWWMLAIPGFPALLMAIYVIVRALSRLF